MKFFIFVGLGWLTLHTIADVFQQRPAFSVQHLPRVSTLDYSLEIYDRSDTIWNISAKDKLNVICYTVGTDQVCKRIVLVLRDNDTIFNARFSSTTLLGPDFQFEDFNFDGIKDLTIRSEEALRGANDIRRLFLYSNDGIFEVKNAEWFPNLTTTPNQRLIRSWIFTGNNTTVFLHLQEDSLVEDVWVDQYPDSIVLKIGDQAEKTLPNSFGDFYFFEDYSPLK